MKDFLNDVNNGKFNVRDEISELQTLKIGDIVYSIPINSSPKLRMYLASAIQSYSNNTDFYDELNDNDIGNFDDSASIDKYLIINVMVSRAVDTVKQIIVDFYKDIIKTNLTLTIGENQYFLSLVRLNNSFKSAIVLCNDGFFLEMMPILRMIFEQLSLCCYVIDEPNDDKIIKNKVTDDISCLKTKINPKYGELYGLLTKETHLAPDQTGVYSTVIDYQTIISYNRSGKKAKENIPLLIELYYIYVQVFKYGLEHFNRYDNYYKEFYNTETQLIDLLKGIYKGDIGLDKLEIEHL